MEDVVVERRKLVEEVERRELVEVVEEERPELV